MLLLTGDTVFLSSPHFAGDICVLFLVAAEYSISEI